MLGIGASSAGSDVLAFRESMEPLGSSYAHLVALDFPCSPLSTLCNPVAGDLLIGHLLGDAWRPNIGLK